MLALESETDRTLSRANPLDALVAQTQGLIGYWLVQGLANAGVTKPLVSLVTQVRVSADDLALALPTKFVGAVYSQALAQELADHRGWTVAADGSNWRRVVPSPEPPGIEELETIEALLRRGSIVVCGGGGGAPVVLDQGQLRGVEVVVDKDLVASPLATGVQADLLIVLTDVAGVMRDVEGRPSRQGHAG